MERDPPGGEPGRGGRGDGGLVDVVRHLVARHRPTVDALRLIAEGTLPAYGMPGRAGWWVEASQLEASLSQHGPRMRAETARRFTVLGEGARNV